MSTADLVEYKIRYQFFLYWVLMSKYSSTSSGKEDNLTMVTDVVGFLGGLTLVTVISPSMGSWRVRNRNGSKIDSIYS